MVRVWANSVEFDGNSESFFGVLAEMRLNLLRNRLNFVFLVHFVCLGILLAQNCEPFSVMWIDFNLFWLRIMQFLTAASQPMCWKKMSTKYTWVAL